MAVRCVISTPIPISLCVTLFFRVVFRNSAWAWQKAFGRSGEDRKKIGVGFAVAR